MQKERILNHDQCKKYIDLLFSYKNKFNLVSNNLDVDCACRLVEESLFLGEKISSTTIIDVGSGNGLLGIPIAIFWPQKKINVIESNGKKTAFLQTAKEILGLINVEVFCISILEYLHKKTEKKICLIARGFPKNELLYQWTLKKRISELLLLTSKNKIKKIMEPIENWQKNYYNVPERNHLVLYKMEYVSRET